MENNTNIVESLQNFLESRLNDIHTMIPGKINSYDDKTGLAQIVPTVKLKRKIGDTIIEVEIPPIDKVPVMSLLTQSFNLKFPIKKGDGCSIYFSEVGIGNFLNAKGGTVSADDANRFALTDAICIVGLWGKNRPDTAPTIELLEDGTLNILPAGGDINIGETNKGIAITKVGTMNLLNGSSPFVKGDIAVQELSTWATAISVAAVTAVDPASTTTAVQAIGVACDAFLLKVASINSTKIKGE